jgi:hypothetical protein
MGPAQANTTTSSSSSSAIPMSTPTSTIKQLLANIPHLEPNGSNWAIFQMRFCEAMLASCHWGYFDGTIQRPAPSTSGKPTDDEKTAMAKWDHEDLLAHYLLSQHLPDTTAIRLSNVNTAKEHWTKVSNEYKAKSTYAQNDLEQAFLEMRCVKGTDIQTFLTTLHYRRKELAAAGVTITDRDYQHTVLRGIPDELAKFTSSLLSAARITNSLTTVDTDSLINHICEEADHMKNRRARDQPGKSGGKREGQQDEALAATGSDNGRRGHRRKGKCHNCGRVGHWSCECRSPKKEEGNSSQSGQTASGTSSKPENKPVGSANAIIYDDEGDGFWLAEETDEEVPLVHSKGV